MRRARPDSYGWIMVRLSSVIVWVLALGLMTGACATSGAVPRPFPTPERRLQSPTAEHRSEAEAPAVADSDQPLPLVATAIGFQGTPYRSGGSDPTGFDCSGFTQYVFAQHGVALPRDVRD